MSLSKISSAVPTFPYVSTLSQTNKIEGLFSRYAPKISPANQYHFFLIISGIVLTFFFFQWCYQPNPPSKPLRTLPIHLFLQVLASQQIMHQAIDASLRSYAKHGRITTSPEKAIRRHLALLKEINISVASQKNPLTKILQRKSVQTS